MDGSPRRYRGASSHWSLRPRRRRRQPSGRRVQLRQPRRRRAQRRARGRLAAETRRPRTYAIPRRPDVAEPFPPHAGRISAMDLVHRFGINEAPRSYARRSARLQSAPLVERRGRGLRRPPGASRTRASHELRGALERAILTPPLDYAARAARRGRALDRAGGSREWISAKRRSRAGSTARDWSCTKPWSTIWPRKTTRDPRAARQTPLHARPPGSSSRSCSSR